MKFEGNGSGKEHIWFLRDKTQKKRNETHLDTLLKKFIRS